MLSGGGNKLSKKMIDSIRQQAIDLAEGGDRCAAWNSLKPLLEVQPRDKDAAKTLLEIVHLDCLSQECALTTLEAIDASHSGDVEIVSLIGDNLDMASNVNFLNAAPAEHSIFPRTIEFLEKTWKLGKYENEVSLLDGLSTAARIFARQKDEIAEQAYRRLIELEPATAFRHYNYGLFLKARGRFEEGIAANLTASDLSTNPGEATKWNLGICATGANRGDVALKVWKELGQHVEMGMFDLPQGSYPQCKVRLAERPLAERTSATDNPGQEETVWIERLSACHGIIRSVLYYDLGVNYGDVVLFDGAPIAHHKYDDVEVPVFPHLATLRRRNYQFFDFAGTQDKPERLGDINAALKGDAVVYSHTDNVINLCSTCWNDPKTNHARHEATVKHVVTGKIAAPSGMDPRELLLQLDAGMSEIAPCQLYSPTLCDAAGLSGRAQIQQHWFDMLINN